MNLYGFVENNGVSKVDPFGLVFWLTGCSKKPSCKCVAVSVTPGSSISQIVAPIQNPQTPGPTHTMNLGLKTPFSIQIQGDPKHCKCKYVDKGIIKFSVNGEKGERSFSGPKDEHDIDCGGGTDWPGLELNIGPSGSFKYTLDYDMSVTVICEGTDGSKSATAKIKGNYEGTATW